MRRSPAVALILAAGLFAGCDRHKDHPAPATQASATTRPVKLSNAPAPSQVQKLAKLESVAEFNGPMPTGVTISHEGRIFVNFPKWGDDVRFTVGELKDGKAAAYPDQQMNTPDQQNAEKALVSVQSVVVDAKDRLWILDTGSIQFGPPAPGAAKLVGIDLSTNKVFKTITFPDTVCLSTTYLNDVRFDLNRGKGGMAFITDSSSNGPGGIIVVNLDSGQSWRKLSGHPSTSATPNFIPTVEGQPLMEREPGKQPKAMTMASDGIAISPDARWLYYSPLSSRKLYRVSVDVLADRNISEDQTAKAVEDLGDKPGASDGLICDHQGRVYCTDYEHNAIHRYANGKFETIAQDPQMIWPDTLSLSTDGYLYFTANQLNRQARFHDGKDLRQKPYHLFRIKVDAKPSM